MTIRPYLDSDQHAVMALWREVFAYSAPHNEPLAVIRHKLAVQPELFFVVTVDGQLAGTVMGGYDGHRGWLYSLAVSPRHRRRGLGTALTRHVEQALADRGCPKVNLQVLASNAEVVAFYRKLGFSVEERLSMGKLLTGSAAAAANTDSAVQRLTTTSPAKKALGPVNCLYPMPTVLVGALVNGKPNYLAVVGVGGVNYNAVSIASQKEHYTNVGIKQNGTFSINIPSEELVAQTDYCGLVSGKDVDKSSLFESFYGQLKTAPMIANCPLSIECMVIQTLDFGSHEAFVGQIVQSYASEKVLTDWNVDFAKVKPFFYEMSQTYWTLGKPLAKAWDVGKQLRETTPGRLDGCGPSDDQSI